MVDYRIYCLDGDGSIGFADWIEAESDQDAILQARELKPDAHQCEIWGRNRLIAKFSGAGRFEQVDGPQH